MDFFFFFFRVFFFCPTFFFFIICFFLIDRVFSPPTHAQTAFVPLFFSSLKFFRRPAAILRLNYWTYSLISRYKLSSQSPFKKTKEKEYLLSRSSILHHLLTPPKMGFFAWHALLPPQPAAVPPAVNCGPHVTHLSGRARPVHCRAPHHTSPSKAGQELPGTFRLGVSLYCVVVWRRRFVPSGEKDVIIWPKERLHVKRKDK